MPLPDARAPSMRRIMLSREGLFATKGTKDTKHFVRLVLLAASHSVVLSRAVLLPIRPWARGHRQGAERGNPCPLIFLRRPRARFARHIQISGVPESSMRRRSSVRSREVQIPGSEDGDNTTRNPRYLMRWYGASPMRYAQRAPPQGQAPTDTLRIPSEAVREPEADVAALYERLDFPAIRVRSRSESGATSSPYSL
jgi:hypothetical protein